MIEEKVLTPTENRALCLIASGYSVKETASETGVTERTINRWMNKVEFQKLLREAVAATYDACLAELVSGSRLAAQKLKEIINDPDVPSRTKVSAIGVLLQYGSKAKEYVVDERLERLEEMVDESVTG